MHSQALACLEVARVCNDDDLEAMIAVRRASDPERPPPRIDNLRHNLSSQPDLVYLVARLGGAPVGCGFMHPVYPEFAEAHLVVVPNARRRGIGSVLLTAIGDGARAAAKAELQGEVQESDEQSRSFLERRGFRVVGGEKAVVLDLAEVEIPVPSPPPGVTIMALSERPDVVEALYPVGAEAAEDIPGVPTRPTYEEWRATDIDRPSRDAELFFVALAGDRPIGYAALENLGGSDVHHGLTAVRRDWRRRGVATALKQTQIAAAKRAGFRRLITENEERNEPIRKLNAKLGYRPELSLSTLVLRGPADVRSVHGDD